MSEARSAPIRAGSNITSPHQTCRKRRRGEKNDGAARLIGPSSAPAQRQKAHSVIAAGHRHNEPQQQSSSVVNRAREPHRAENTATGLRLEAARQRPKESEPGGALHGRSHPTASLVNYDDSASRAGASREDADRPVRAREGGRKEASFTHSLCSVRHQPSEKNVVPQGRGRRRPGAHPRARISTKTSSRLSSTHVRSTRATMSQSARVCPRASGSPHSRRAGYDTCRLIQQPERGHAIRRRGRSLHARRREKFSPGLSLRRDRGDRRPGRNGIASRRCSECVRA